MIFRHEKAWGRDRYYPVSKNAIELVEKFPHSNGKRKSFTRDQMEILNRHGLKFDIHIDNEKILITNKQRKKL